MLFNSIPFLIFFALVYVIYWNISARFRHRFLILSGFVFYGYFSIPFLFHFLFVIALNYYLYYKIKTGNSGFYVKISVILNLLNLGFFKYFYFFTKFLGDINGNEAFLKAPDLVSITLPLAISFYSFQMIAAAIDAYRKKEGEIISFETYLL
ncbi:MAG: hypothetical protein K8R21_12040, partial [Leptospira sp.]|nr:hypothetical protein [Leptospira sp.]